MTQRGNGLSKTLTCIATVSIFLVGLTAHRAAAQTSARPDAAPAGKPALMGMVHADVASLRKELPALVKKLQPFMPPAIGAKIPALTKMLDKIEAVDVFVLTAGRQPMPVAAISGKLTPQDIADILSMFAGAKIPPTKTSEGRYAMGPIETVTSGKRMFVAPAGMLTKDMLGLIVTGEEKMLTGTLAKADRKAHVWGGAEGLEKMDHSAPTHVTGSASLGKKLSGTVKFVFPSVKFAERMEKDVTGEKSFTGKLFTAERVGTAVTLTINGSVDELLVELAHARKMAKRAVSMAKLKGIGTAIEMYKMDNNGSAPPTLAKMVEISYLSAKMLLSPSSGRTTIKTDAKGIPTEPGDYEYIVVPDSAPGGLVRVYEPLKINGGEGSCVSYVDTHVEWVTPKKLKDDLDRTHKCLAENSK